MVLAKDNTVVEQFNNMKRTVLHVVCLWRHKSALKEVKRLLKAGADPNATDISVSPKETNRHTTLLNTFYQGQRRRSSISNLF